MNNQPTPKPVRFMLEAYRHWTNHCLGRCDLIVKAEAVKGSPAMHSSKDGLVVLNIGYEAVRNYEAFDDRFEFNCLFRGVEFRMSINYFDVIGIRGPLGLIHPINVITVVDGAGNYLLAPIFPANGEIHPMTVAQETPPPSADDGVDNIKPFTASSDEKPKGSHLRVVK